jgi:hypothetical protein
MSTLRTIEIDVAVHRAIETARHSFSETDNDILRRLLRISSVSTASTPPKRSWSWKGVTLPHGTELRMTYNGQEYIGQISNGKWVVGRHEFNSPSGAASGVAVTKDGSKTKLDGWKLWYVKRATDTDWVLIDALRSPLRDIDLDV